MMSTSKEDMAAFYMRIAIAEARKSPPKPTNFCVGACIVDEPSNLLLTTGYTLECEGNTHAEQSCFIKLAESHDCNWEQLGELLPEGTVLYTTMEPCNKRSVGNLPCVERILLLKRSNGKQAIGKVYVGLKEPTDFVAVNEGEKRLRDAGIEVVQVRGLEEEVRRIATAGHVKEGGA